VILCHMVWVRTVASGKARRAIGAAQLRRRRRKADAAGGPRELAGSVCCPAAAATVTMTTRRSYRLPVLSLVVPAELSLAFVPPCQVVRAANCALTTVGLTVGQACTCS
jgi:hypothetical protein